jgi:hypothetical protein
VAPITVTYPLAELKQHVAVLQSRIEEIEQRLGR